jgi:hypothetical protein
VRVSHNTSQGSSRSVRRGLFASLLAGETRPATCVAGFLDATAREAARGVGLLEPAVRWCATAGFCIVVLEKSGFPFLLPVLRATVRKYGQWCWELGV